jgi:hypothetical protein
MTRIALLFTTFLWLLASGCRGSSADGDPDGWVDLDSDGLPDHLDSESGLHRDTGDDPSATDGPVCGEADVSFEMQIPTVILLLDQSGSMTDPFGNTNRWDAVYETLFDPDNGIVQRLDDSVRFGMQLYTSLDGFSGGECPLLTGVPAAMNNYQAMNDVYRSSSPSSDTPTGESIDAVVDLLAADTEPGKKIIVLATDGEPDTCEAPNPQQGQSEAIEAAMNAYANGISVFIVSVGDDVGEAHLTEMANAGQGFALDAADGADYYLGLDPDSLTDAFQDIIGGVRECVLSVQGKVVEGSQSKCKVRADGTLLPFESDDGWRLNNASEIEILGESCDRILSGEISNLKVTCPCGSVVVV